MGIEFIDTILSVPIGFKFIIVIGLIIVALIGYVIEFECGLFIPQLYDTITLEIGLISIDFNGIIVLLSVLIGFEFITAIASITGNIIGYVIEFE